MIFDLAVITAGLLLSLLLFRRFPIPGTAGGETRPEAHLKAGIKTRPEAYPQTGEEICPIRVSVIIPARNEERNLPLLLSDLKSQNLQAYEVICADDGSEDGTARIAASFGALLLSLPVKPENWIGKSWACQNGADNAGGDAFLFLDADVRLGPDGLHRLIRTYQQSGSVISVLPYHKTEKKYEQLSLFFNLVQFAANGLGLPFARRHIGLYGPVILISRQDYYAAGGHASIKNSIIDDVALGKKLKEAGIPFRLFLGDKDISFRMYRGGVQDLLNGWTKNQAAGAMNTPAVTFLMVFLWVTSCTSAPVQIIRSVIQGSYVWAGVFLSLYFLWVLELKRISSRTGSFTDPWILFYPVPLLVFLGVFFRSLFKKIFHRKVVWKDREIRLGK